MADPRPRRGRGEDSIYLDRADNYWVGAVSLGYKAGKRVRKTVTGRTKTAVKAKLRQLRQELDNGVRSSATYTVGNALDDWLAGGLSGRSDRTRELYRDTSSRCGNLWATLGSGSSPPGMSSRLWTRWPTGCRPELSRSCATAWSGPSGTPRSVTWSAGMWRRSSSLQGVQQAVRPRA